VLDGSLDAGGATASTPKSGEDADTRNCLTRRVHLTRCQAACRAPFS